MVSMAAGMATFGYIPYVATFASFLGLLCAEQMRTDLAYPNLPVRLLAHHAGISLGFYGTSHHATEDLGLLRSMANMTVVCPCDAMPRGARSRTRSIFRARSTCGSDADGTPTCTTASEPFKVGRLRSSARRRRPCDRRQRRHRAPALEAALTLAGEGIEVAVLDAHTVRPFDAERLCEAAGRVGRCWWPRSTT